MKTKSLILTVIFLVTVGLNLSFAFDHTRYVDVTNGLDENSGTDALNAWNGFHHALDQINADSNILTDDTILLMVAPGTYSASGLMADAIISRSNLTIRGDGAATTILDGTGADTGYWQDGIIIPSGITNIIISDMKIINFAGYAGIKIESGTGVMINNCEMSGNNYGIYLDGISVENSPGIHSNTIKSNDYGIYMYAMGAIVSPTIKGNSISDSLNAGIYVTTGSTAESHPIIQENTFFNNIKGIEVSVGSGKSSPDIFSNRMYDNTTGIYFTNGGAVTSSPEITNNIIYKDTGTMATGIALYGGPTAGSILDVKIYHNTIDGGTDNGIYTDVQSGIINADIKYCIITNFTGGGSSYGILNANTATLTIDYVDIWNNATARCSNCPSSFDLDTDNLDADPKFEVDYSIKVTSPCIDKIPSTESDPVDHDIIGTSRPRKKDSTVETQHDIGAYEYPYKAYDFTMPGGTGLAADYRLMTLPVQVTSSSLSTALTDAYGAYDTEKWRAFVWDGAAYVELGESGFDTLTYNASLSSHAGRAFWVISLDGALTNDTNTFDGILKANKQPATIPLSIGWNMIALPWPPSTENPSIELGNIVVADDTGKFWITSANNPLTDNGVWEYTGTGTTGYTMLYQSTDLLVAGKGYWIKVLAATSIDLVIPPDNGSHLTALKKNALRDGPPAAPVFMEPPPSPPVSKKASGSIFNSNESVFAEGGNGCFIDLL